MTAIAAQACALRAGETSCVEIAEAALAAAEAHEALNAMAHVDHAGALRAATALDRELRSGHVRGPLHGIPITVKDVIDVAGLPRRMGTPRAAHTVPDKDATIVHLLREAGVVVVGKAATHELAFGTTCPGVRNPHDPDRLAGGSSGGSAVAVAAGIGLGSIGTDTGGSVRIPAALCGIVGLKPTHGLLPRHRIAPLAPSQDVPGLLAPDLDSCAALFAALTPAGDDDSWTGPSDGFRLGVLQGCLTNVQSGVRARFLGAIERLVNRGTEIRDDIPVPGASSAPAASAIAILFEASMEWGRVAKADPWGFSPEILGALSVGAAIDPRDHRLAREGAAELGRRVTEVLDEYELDGLLTPTLPITAAEASVPTVKVGTREVPIETAHVRHVSLASVTGLPAVSVPCGADENGLPVAMQVLGRRSSDARLLDIAGAICPA